MLKSISPGVLPKDMASDEFFEGFKYIPEFLRENASAVGLNSPEMLGLLDECIELVANYPAIFDAYVTQQTEYDTKNGQYAALRGTLQFLKRTLDGRKLDAKEKRETMADKLRVLLSTALYGHIPSDLLTETQQATIAQRLAFLENLWQGGRVTVAKPSEPNLIDIKKVGARYLVEWLKVEKEGDSEPECYNVYEATTPPTFLGSTTSTHLYVSLSPGAHTLYVVSVNTFGENASKTKTITAS